MRQQRFIRDKHEPTKRVFMLSLVVTAVFFLLFTRLWYLQILKSDELREQSESNRLRFLPVAASRGGILDRNGKIIVSNRPSFSLAVIQKDVQDKEALINRLSQLLKIDSKEIAERWEKGKKRRAKYFPIILVSNLTRDQLELIEENRLNLPGVTIEMKPVRQYPNGLLAAHLLGPIGEISESELDNERYKDYNPGDYIGKSGIEKALEHDLHGVDGGKQIEVDALGRMLRTVRETQPIMGNTVFLTIDQLLQQRAEEAFNGQAGAAVAMDVNTGEILTFVSTPSFDPALFAGRISPQQWKAYLEDKRHPLENKALKGQYPPGSTFKIVTALAGLEEGLIDERTTVYCTGSYRHGNREFRCWERKGHGTVNLKKAMKQSCDVYFYQLGERLGVDKIAFYSKKFGLGSPVGVGFDHEKSGLIPTTAWKEQRYKKKWFSGETLPVAIGQGYVLTTPLQLASMISAVSTNGAMYKPYLVKKILDQDGKVLKEFHPELVRKVEIKEKSFEQIKPGLVAVVNEGGGTGGRSRLAEVMVAGKTGTSQVVKLPSVKGYIPYQFRDHALFVAFAPAEKPEIAVAVVVEHGEHGGSAAAPIAGAILRAYFEQKGVIAKPQPKNNEMPPVDEDRETPDPGVEPAVVEASALQPQGQQ